MRSGRRCWFRGSSWLATAVLAGLTSSACYAQSSYLVMSFESEADLFVPENDPPPAGTPTLALSSQYGVTQGTYSMEVVPTGYTMEWLLKNFDSTTYAEWYDHQTLAFDFTRVTSSAGNYALQVSMNGPQGWNEKELVSWAWQNGGLQTTNTITWDYGDIRAAAPAPGSGETEDFWQMGFIARTNPDFAPQLGFIDNIRFINPVAAVDYTWAGDGTNPGGTGFWSTLFEDVTWIDPQAQPVTWEPYKRAVFGATAGTVTVSGPIDTRNGMAFDTAGYSVVADSNPDYTSQVALGGVNPEANVIEVAAGVSAEISVPLTGSNGLSKTGPGTLVLSGENPVAGRAVVSGGTLQLATAKALARAEIEVGPGGTLAVPAGVIPEGQGIRLAGGTLSAPVINVTTGLDTRSYVVNDFATPEDLYAENPSSGMRNIAAGSLADQPAMQATMVRGSEYAWSFKDYDQEALDAWREHTQIAMDITMVNDGEASQRAVGNVSLSIDNTWQQTGSGPRPRFVNYVTVPAGETVSRTYTWDYSDLLDTMPQTGESIQLSLSMALETEGEQTWYFQNLRFTKPRVPLAVGVGALTVESGTIAGTPELRVLNGGVVTLPTDTRYVMSVSSLDVDASPDQPSGAGLVDLGAGQISVASGGISAADLRADIIAGRNGGAWNGTAGITSAAAAASGGTRSVGYVTNSDGSAAVSYAAAGDVDLSGAVNVFDLVSINSGGKYGSGTASIWQQGDFNYDGVTNVFDLVGVNTAGAYGQGNYFPTATSAAGGMGSVAAVPEPASLGLVAIGLGLTAAIRRRRR